MKLKLKTVGLFALGILFSFISGCVSSQPVATTPLLNVKIIAS